MNYPSYLIHYNKNHNPKNGQFAPGDGGGDGQVNDNLQQKSTPKKKGLSKGARIGLGIGLGVVGVAAVTAGAIGLGKTISDTNRSKKLKEATSAATKGKSYIEINVENPYKKKPSESTFFKEEMAFAKEYAKTINPPPKPKSWVSPADKLWERYKQTGSFSKT